MTRLALAVLVLLPAIASADEPPKSRVEKDLRDKLDPEWVAKADKVTLKRKGETQLREGYLGPNDVKTTTFYGFDYDVRYDYKAGGGKVCEMEIVYFKKEKTWRLDRVTESAQCRAFAAKGQEAPQGEDLVAIVKPELDKFLQSKYDPQSHPEFKNADIKNLVARQIDFSTYKEQFSYDFGGEFDVGDRHCSTCSGDQCKPLFTILKKNLQSPWTLDFIWPYCEPRK